VHDPVARTDQAGADLQRSFQRPRLAAHPYGGCRRPRHQGQALEGVSGGQQDLHGPSRDGYNQLPYLTGQQDRGARNSYFYFNDDGDFVAIRRENWKAVFEEQRAPGTLLVWAEPFTKLRLPKLYDLRSDPYEKADITSNTYYDWYLSNAGLIYGLLAESAKFLETFKEFPPSQSAGSFNLDAAVAKLRAATSK